MIHHNDQLRRIRFTADTVIKSGPPEMMRIEAEKMVQAHKIGAHSGLFSVPQIVEMDERMGVLTLRRIPNIRGIRNASFGGDTWAHLMQRLGRAIALVHEELQLPEDMHIPLPPELLGPAGAGAYLHGDLSSENVCVTAHSDPQLVILDWQFSPRYGGGANWGARYFDVAWFIGNLFRKPIYKHLGGVSANMAASVFIDSYFREARASVSKAEFAAYHEEFRLHRMLTQEQRLSWPRRMLLAHGFSLWEQFARDQMRSVGSG